MMGTVELVGEIKVAPAGNGHEVVVGALSDRGWAPHQVVFLRVLFYLDEKSPKSTRLRVKENHDLFEICKAVSMSLCIILMGPL